MRVISGFQTGADQAGVFAAFDVGLQTGGHIPKGCRTLVGPNFEATQVYGLVETEENGWLPRTILNVKNSDVTLRFATSWSSGGEKATIREINKAKKPHRDFSWSREGDVFHDSMKSWQVADPKEVAEWLVSSGFGVVNIAGNSESTCPGICLATYQFLTSVFIHVLELCKEPAHTLTPEQEQSECPMVRTQGT